MFTAKEAAIIHEAIHQADFHNLKKDSDKVAILFKPYDQNVYVKYNHKDINSILEKLLDLQITQETA